MSDERMFMPEPEPERAEAPPVFDPAAYAPPSTAQPQYSQPQYGEPQYGQPAGYQAYAPRGSSSDQVREVLATRGPSNYANHYGHYALALGVTTIGLDLILYLVGGGLWWLYVVMGGAAVYYGRRGVSAASAGAATNGRMALTGAILGLVGAIAAALYLVFLALLLSSALIVLGA